MDLQDAVFFNRSNREKAGAPNGVRAGSDFERRLAQLVAAWQAANDLPVDGKWTEEVSRTLDQTFMLE